MNLKSLKISDSESSFTKFEAWFRELYYKNEDEGKEPSEDGTYKYDFGTGKLLGIYLTNWDWLQDNMYKILKKAKTLGLTCESVGGSDYLVINPTAKKWIDKIAEKLDNLQDWVDNKLPNLEEKYYQRHPEAYEAKVAVPRDLKVKKEDFDKFMRWTECINYKRYADYSYNEVKDYIK